MRRKLIDFYRRYQKFIFVVAIFFVIGFAAVLGTYLKIGSYGKYILSSDPAIARTLSEPPVALILGGGIEDGKPRPLLQDRLDTAVHLYEQGRVQKLLVSGDNRFENYNEPEVMLQYLVQKGVPVDDIQLDNAGRSTYESCERAQKVFGLKKVLLVSQATHLPRAIYLCRSFGIEAYGFAADEQAATGLHIAQRWREVMARTKAGINVHLLGEKTVLGEQIQL